MKSPIIHIGFHKTATTWLQENLFSDGKYGFSTVDGAHPANFAWHFIYGGKRGLKSPFDFNASEIFNLYLEMTKNSSGKIIISNEDLVSHMFSGGVMIRDIGRNLRETFSSAKILITVRRQQDLIRSCYEDMLEGGGACSIERFLESGNDNQIPLFCLDFLKYHNTIELYRNLFGEDNVLVLPYEGFCQNPSNFVESIFQFAEINDYSAKDLCELYHKPINAHSGNRATAMYYLRLLNLIGKPTNNNAKLGLNLQKVHKMIFYYSSKLLPKIITKRYKKEVNEKICQKTKNFYQKSNRIFQEMVGWDLRKYGYDL